MQLEEWKAARGNTDQALVDCTAVLDTLDAPQLVSLRAEVQDYWRLLEFLTTIPERDRRVLGSQYVNREVVRRRGATLDLVDRINQMSARQMESGDAQLEKTFNTLRIRLIAMLAVTGLVGLALVVFTLRRARRWGGELGRRYQEGARPRQERKDLSARLVSAQEE